MNKWSYFIGFIADKLNHLGGIWQQTTWSKISCLIFQFLNLWRQSWCAEKKREVPFVIFISFLNFPRFYWYMYVILYYRIFWINMYVIYCKIASSNTSRLEAHVDFFKLLMKGIWGSLCTVTFWQKVDFFISNAC